MGVFHEWPVHLLSYFYPFSNLIGPSLSFAKVGTVFLIHAIKRIAICGNFIMDLIYCLGLSILIFIIN